MYLNTQTIFLTNCVELIREHLILHFQIALAIQSFLAQISNDPTNLSGSSQPLALPLDREVVHHQSLSTTQQRGVKENSFIYKVWLTRRQEYLRGHRTQRK
jgi:hypothetical protein